MEPAIIYAPARLSNFFARPHSQLHQGGRRDTARRPLTRALSTLLLTGLVSLAAVQPAEAHGMGYAMAAAEAHAIETQRDAMAETVLRATTQAMPSNLNLSSAERDGGFVAIGDDVAVNLAALDYAQLEGTTLRLQVDGEIRFVDLHSTSIAKNVADTLAAQAGFMRVNESTVINADTVTTARFEGGRLKLSMIGDMTRHGHAPGRVDGRFYMDGPVLDVPAAPSEVDSLLKHIVKKHDGLRIGDTAVRLTAFEEIIATDDNTLTLKSSGGDSLTISGWSETITQARAGLADQPGLIQVERDSWRNVTTLGLVRLTDDGIQMQGPGIDTSKAYDGARADAIRAKLSAHPGYVQLGTDNFIHVAAVDYIQKSMDEITVGMGQRSFTFTQPDPDAEEKALFKDGRLLRIGATFVNTGNLVALKSEGDSVKATFSRGSVDIYTMTQRIGMLESIDGFLHHGMHLFNGTDGTQLNQSAVNSYAFQPGGWFGEDRLVALRDGVVVGEDPMGARKAGLYLNEMTATDSMTLDRVADATVNLKTLRWADYSNGTLSLDLGQQTLALPALRSDFQALTGKLVAPEAVAPAVKVKAQK